MKRLMVKLNNAARILCNPGGTADRPASSIPAPSAPAAPPPSTPAAIPTSTPSTTVAIQTSVTPLATEKELESASKPESKERRCDNRLESLPPEIRRHLLSVLDLPRLKALVRASPTFHEQYLFDRTYLLCRSLEETLGSVIVDAYAVSQFGVGKRDRWTRHPPPTTELPLPELLNTYSGHTVRRCLRLDGNLTQDKILSMATFYLGVVEPIMASSARWALGNLAKEVQGDHQDCEQGIALTLPELVRLTRATYRFHLLGRFANTDDIPRGSYRMPSVDALFRLWEPWEVEEVFSFYKFAHDVYAKICKDISWDVHPDNPRFDDQQRPPTPRGAFEINMEYDAYSYNYIDGSTLQGLPLLHEVLFKIKDHEHLVSVMQDNLRTSPISLDAMTGVFSSSDQDSRRSECPSERDRMQEERAPFPFRGDGEPGESPLAWTTIWGGTYSNLYGYYLTDTMRRCGYVFWDAARLERTGVMEVLVQEWKREWEQEDPRDMVFL